MNRLMLFNIFMGVLKHYIETQEVGIENFKKIVDSVPFEEYDEDKCAYVESLLVFYIFTNIPYYKIESTLDCIKKKLKISCSAYDKYNALSRIICDGCVAELMPSLKRRVETEVNMHILELAGNFYREGRLSSKKTIESEKDAINRLAINICNTISLTGTSTAENLFYTQVNFLESPQSKKTLREDISRSNSRFACGVTDALRDNIVQYYDMNTLENFINLVDSQIKKSDLKDKELIYRLICQSLEKLIVISAKIWAEKEEVQFKSETQEKTEGYQYTLANYLS